MPSWLSETIKITALRLARWPGLSRLFRLYYRAAAWFLERCAPENCTVLLRGSYVSGQLVPGLSDLDSEVIVRGGPELLLQVRAVQRSYAGLRRLFPFLQDPFVRSWDEFLFCRRQQHEWLLYSQWSVLGGSSTVPEQPSDQLLPLLRLCLRELTKNLPANFFAAPLPDRLGQARLNADRLAILQRLCRLLSIESPYLDELEDLRASLQRDRYLTRQARPLLARAMVAYLRVLDQAVGRGVPGVAGTLRSNGGCRYYQAKHYLLAGEDSDQQLVERLLEAARDWRRPDPEWSLSYEAPILFSQRLLPLAHLGFGSCFEGAWLHRQGWQLEQPYRQEALARELADGVYLLRKKLPRQQTFLLYLQDYLVGVYPALALALDQGLWAATPEEASDLYGHHYDDLLSVRLAAWSPRDLRTESRLEVRSDPLGWLGFLEKFQAGLRQRHG